MRAAFNDVNLETDYDFVYVSFKKVDVSSPYRLHRDTPFAITGNDRSATFLSEENVIYITLITDRTVTDRGFSMRFEVLGSNDGKI